MWTGTNNIAAAFRDSSMGLFDISQARSTVVDVPTDFNIFTGECKMADDWFRSARELLLSRSGISVNSYDMRCGPCACACACACALALALGRVAS
jgi:hypothetical protein